MEPPVVDAADLEQCAAPPCERRVDTDLGWALSALIRSYLRATGEVLAELPGGARGYQILTIAAAGQPGTQLALAQRLGIDRTVMTYLLDDLEAAGLVERRPDPADRRARKIVATAAGQARLAEIGDRLTRAEGQVLAALEHDEQVVFRGLLQRLASHADPTNDQAPRC